MSPLPSPTPLRRSILKVLFSPTGLLLGFVAFLIVVCPNARGDGGLTLLAANEAGAGSAWAEVPGLDVRVMPSRPQPVVARSTRVGHTPVSSARSATPAERARATSGTPSSEPFRHSRSALPLLGDPILDATTASPTANLQPMTGPAVGIRPKSPAPIR